MSCSSVVKEQRMPPAPGAQGTEGQATIRIKGQMASPFVTRCGSVPSGALGHKAPRVGGESWQTVVLSPFVGPRLVMALMRFAGISQSRVAAPILIGLATMAALVISVCVYAPQRAECGA